MGGEEKRKRRNPQRFFFSLPFFVLFCLFISLLPLKLSRVGAPFFCGPWIRTRDGKGAVGYGAGSCTSRWCCWAPRPWAGQVSGQDPRDPPPLHPTPTPPRSCGAEPERGDAMPSGWALCDATRFVRVRKLKKKPKKKPKKPHNPTACSCSGPSAVCQGARKRGGKS